MRYPLRYGIAAPSANARIQPRPCQTAIVRIPARQTYDTMNKIANSGGAIDNAKRMLMTVTPINIARRLNCAQVPRSTDSVCSCIATSPKYGSTWVRDGRLMQGYSLRLDRYSRSVRRARRN